jgi:pilus assembly protein FimV
VHTKSPTRLSPLLGLLLALASSQVFALGLGQIDVKSRPGEPLLAEIPIVSSDPRELEQLRARLAPPETFRRIGLQPPQGIVSDLQFSVALDARGRPVVRVTTAEPVQQPVLTFLVEVDWGQGRLVREYSALVGAPGSAAAVAQPEIQAPVAPPPATVVREPIVREPLPPPPPVQAEPLAEAPAPPAEPDPEPPPPAPAPAPVAVVPAPPSAPARDAPITVQQGQTLSEIAGRMDREGYSLNQAMLALMRANPEAFIDGNINLVRAGAVLRVPGREELARLDSAQANAMVRTHVQRWREARQPAPQPAVATAASAASGQASAAAGAPRMTDARLEIVPPGGGTNPGTRSGLSADGEGEMLRTELQQSKEELAARDAELAELRVRIAELEELQGKQQELLVLKDSELATVQQRLAGEREPGAPDAPRDAAPWVLGGLALLLLAAIAWLLLRRHRAPDAPPTRRSYDAAALAASMPGAAKVGAQDGPAVAGTTPAVDRPGESAATITPAAGAAGSPTWHASRSAQDAGAGVVPGAPAGADIPAAAQTPAGGREGLELARAYIDLGDGEAARGLLHEVLRGRDPAAREEAARLLRELG